MPALFLMAEQRFTFQSSLVSQMPLPMRYCVKSIFKTSSTSDFHGPQIVFASRGNYFL